MHTVQWEGDDVSELLHRQVEMISQEYEEVEGMVTKITEDWVYLDSGIKASRMHVENGDILVFLKGA